MYNPLNREYNYRNSQYFGSGKVKGGSSKKGTLSFVSCIKLLDMDMSGYGFTEMKFLPERFLEKIKILNIPLVK